MVFSYWRFKNCSTLLGIFCFIDLVVLGNISAEAQTIAHWRFESGAFLEDSSGNAHHLTTNTGPALQVAAPANFLDPVPPVTGGLSNTMSASIPNTGLLSAPDSDDFTAEIFTIEALIRPDSLRPGTNVIVGHHDSPVNQRGWFLGAGGDGTVRVFTSTDGVAAAGFNGLASQIVAGNEYYIGATVSLGEDIGPNGANLFGTLYLRDLTAGGPLQTFQYSADPTFSTLNNVPGPLAIGSTSTGPDGTANFDGIIDEVRYSHGVLDLEDLLVYFPGIEIEGTSTITGVLTDPGVDGSIASLTVTRDGASTNYLPSDWVGGTLTAYGGSANGAEFIMPPSATDAPPSDERANTLGDGLADTGFINLTSWSVTFDQDIENRPGPDILLFDWGSADTIDVTINGTTLDDATATTTEGLQVMSGRPRYLSDQFPVDSLEELETATFGSNGSTSANNNIFGFDLSDFGFAEGASLLAGTEVAFSDGTTIDPMEVVALLEPAGIPGDFDDDGDADGADFLAWQRGFGTTFDTQALVDWEGSYGTANGGLSATHAVPEPSLTVLLATAVLLPLLCR